MRKTHRITDSQDTPCPTLHRSVPYSVLASSDTQCSISQWASASSLRTASVCRRAAARSMPTRVHHAGSATASLLGNQRIPGHRPGSIALIPAVYSRPPVRARKRLHRRPSVALTHRRQREACTAPMPRARNDTRQRKACRGAIAPPLLGVSHGDSSARLASSRCLRAREHAAGRRPASIGTCASRRLSPSWANRDRQRVRRRRATHRRSCHRRGNHGRRLAARRWRPIASRGHECRLVARAPAASVFPATGQAREH